MSVLVCSVYEGLVTKKQQVNQTNKSVNDHLISWPNGHLKISWTSTAELEIDKISRDDLIRVHV